VILQHAVSSNTPGLQSQEFVACFSSEKTKLTELRAEFVPGFQSSLTLFKQHLVFGVHGCPDGELAAHFASPFVDTEALCAPKE